MTLANGPATSEERDNEDDAANHDQCYRWECEIIGNFFHTVGIVLASDFHNNTQS